MWSLGKAFPAGFYGLSFMTVSFMTEYRGGCNIFSTNLPIRDDLVVDSIGIGRGRRIGRRSFTGLWDEWRKSHVLREVAG